MRSSPETMSRNGNRSRDAGECNAFTFVLRGLARLALGSDTLDPGVRERLLALTGPESDAGRDDDGRLLSEFKECLRHPAEADSALAQVAHEFQLHPIEAVAVRLAIAAEQDLLISHLLSHLQQPLALSRPTIGLVAQAYAPDEVHRAIHELGQGNASRCGLLQLCGEDRPLLERQLRIPLPIALALQGIESSWPGTSPVASDQDSSQPRIPLGKTSEARAEAMARRLAVPAMQAPALVIRCGDSVEARTAAALVCHNLGMRAVLVQSDQLAGMAPWLILNELLPVFTQWLTPGERKAVPAIPGFSRAVILLSGPEGEFEADDRAVIDWRIETPAAAERVDLWQAATGNPELAQRLAAEHRHSAGRIAMLAQKAREEAVAGEDTHDAPFVSYAGVRAVSRRGDAVGLGALAELIPDEVDDAALVVSGTLRQELESLVVRCRHRERFPSALGPSIQARYRPSVRALFVGPSGTGKTLAVAWLATRLGIPLFRVDLSAITSKYIGETEKNLSQLLARAEQNEVLLLFDEADSLFGKRTDIHDSNDRFANSQTNYLLQRMESYDGITILTSNGRGRFDDAFARRFDAIVAFPFPGPEERRELWLAHLGAEHDVTTAQLNLLSAVAELTGGQIRNAVLRGAVAAAQAETNVLYRHLITGVASEYRKLSRQLPNELRQAETAVRA